eukprot:gnl/MRDRNA2_/MRDRNA2_33225_c0_seq1.p1 gnl/MRDRNA2_/MRDRNA2_33225_c0~~gnl/MRDRNA2_/MRDRNA2_33225_c0_seq1.p1  ORF type:complete len:284 (-),score=79.14 gnl/MRDRNA2_/MRDRNA2_33225_c0_seq1:46-897(-)
MTRQRRETSADEYRQNLKKKPNEKAKAYEVGPMRRDLATKKKVAHENAAKEQKSVVRDQDGRVIFASEDDHILFQFGSRGYAWEKEEKGTLGKKHLWMYLKDLSDADSEPLDKNEVDWIMWIADKDDSGTITKDELKFVRVAYHTYCEARRRVATLMARYDLNQNGVIERDELRNLLNDLNDGILVDSSELAEVLENANKFKRDHLNEPELEQAIIFWYSHADSPTQFRALERAKGGVVGRALTAILKAMAAPLDKEVVPNEEETGKKEPPRALKPKIETCKK